MRTGKYFAEKERVLSVKKYKVISTYKMACISLILLAVSSCNRQSGLAEGPEYKPGKIVQLTTDPGDQYSPIFSSDDVYVAYLSTQFGSANVHIYSLEKDSSLRVSTSDYDDRHVRWSPDSKSLTYTFSDGTRTGIKQYFLGHGNTKILMDSLPNTSNANWSPFGNHLVFDQEINGKRNLFLYDLKNATVEQLTDLDQGRAINFGFSFDGQWVGFMTRGSHHDHLQAMHLKTKKTKHLVGSKSGHEWHPRWSRKAFEILFYTTWDGAMTDVWISKGDSISLEQITTKKIEEFGPAWDASEGKIAFFSSLPKSKDIAIYSRKKQIEERLQLNKDLIVQWNPLQWSHTGNLMAFVATDKKDQLYSIRLTGSDSNTLVPNEGNNYQMNFYASKDYEEWLFDDGQNIVIYNPFSRAKRTIAPDDPYHYDEHPKWIPSTDKISFLHLTGGANNSLNLWMMDHNGSSKKPITRNGGVHQYLWIDSLQVLLAYDSEVSDRSGLWQLNVKTGEMVPILENQTVFPTSMAPDGASFLFHSRSGREENIYSMSMEEKTYDTIDTGLKNGRWATYSNDGKHIVFLSNDNVEKTWDIYVIPSEGGRARRMTNSALVENRPRYDLNDQNIIFHANSGNKDIFLVDVEERLQAIK